MATQRLLVATRPTLRHLPFRAASSLQTDHKVMWKEINRLASEGKWDAINNKPEMWLYGDAKKDAYSVYQIFNKSHNFFDGTPYGPILYFIWRMALLAAIVKVSCLVYEFVVPEQKRLHYKYRHHGHHDDGHHGGHQEAAAAHH
ncbi:unnamed protein product, partial [Mesorhabditis spiculigera]